MKRYMIPRVANCCRGSIIERVVPAFLIEDKDEQSSTQRILRIV